MLKIYNDQLPYDVIDKYLKITLLIRQSVSGLLFNGQRINVLPQGQLFKTDKWVIFSLGQEYIFTPRLCMRNSDDFSSYNSIDEFSDYAKEKFWVKKVSATNACHNREEGEVIITDLAASIKKFLVKVMNQNDN